MKKAMLVGLLGIVMLSGRAEAGVGDALKNAFTYAVSPVNCVVELGRDLLNAGVRFVGCFIGNMNRNPATLKPIITAPVSVPTA